MDATTRSLRGVAGRAKAAACLSAGLVAAPIAAPVAAWAAPDLYAAGKPVFDRLCGGCHQVGIGAVNGVGPQLNGVTGRPAGLVADYRYSPRMARSGVVWTPASLDAFIADPRADMPGTRMMVPGVASDGARRAIVTYLGRYRADGHLRTEP